MRISPDTGAVNVRPKSAIFTFDEVVSERPQGAPSLERLFLISPRDGEPRVDWHRKQIAVRPRRGWRPNAVYTITMLGGIADLRGNVRKERTVAVFSTGPTIPATQIAGIAFDWPASKPAGGALIEAIYRLDSTVYVQKADSTGRFVVPHLPAGRYTVIATLDANNNNARDPREAFDSINVVLADSARVELLAFVHDTIGPRISAVSVRDSLSVRVGFDKPIDPTQAIDTSLFTLKAADSSVVPILLVRQAREVEREQAERDRARADSGRGRDSTVRRRDTLPSQPIPDAFDRVRPSGRDTASRTIAGPAPSKPAPPQEFVLQIFPPLKPGVSYRLQARGIRNLLRRTFTSERVFTVPKPPARDSTKAAAPGAPRPAAPGGRLRPDTTARPRPDTLSPVAPRPMAPRDTTRRPPRRA